MTRARLYVLIDAFERDIRSILTRFVLTELPPPEALGSHFEPAQDKRNQDGDADGSLVDYLNLREGYDLLNTHRRLLPEELATEVRQLTSGLDRLVPVRNRVMHARPLIPGDSYAAVSLLNQYQSRYWSELKRTVAQLQADPSWEPIIPVSDTSGYALHNLPLPDYDETGLVGRARETEELVKLLKRGRESVLTITGEGGIGKTALGLEVAYRIVDDPDRPFDAVLWTSLKYEKLTAAGIRNIAGAARDITGAAQPLGRALDEDFQGSLQDLATALNGFRILIFVDNLETVGGNEFKTLYDTLPDTVNYLVTSRVGVGEYERRYPLQPLSREDSLRLFNDFVRARRIAGLEKISGETRVQVVTSLRQSPLAIKWFALAVEAGNDPVQLIRHQDELLEFCVRSVYDALEPGAREVLAVLAILGRPVSVDELVLLLEKKTTDHVNVALQELLRGSLIRRENVSSSGDLGLTISLTETAREFLSRRIKPDSFLERQITRRDREYRTSEERRAADLAKRSLAPYVVRSRSEADNPTAQILRKAMLKSQSKNFDGAIEQVGIARKLNPDFWEVDRVEGFLRSNMGDLGTATSFYKRAYANAQDADRAVVSHFFAGHLARKLRDVRTAITYAQEAHDVLQLAETAVPLGNYLVWSNRFSDGIALIEPATIEMQGRGRVIAITSLSEAYQRWAKYAREEEKNPLLAYARAKKGCGIALAALESGISDDKLRDTCVDCCIESLQSATQCLRGSTAVPQLSDWLETLTSAIVRFVNSRIWKLLLTAIERMEKVPRCPAAGQQLAEAARCIDTQGSESPGGSSSAADRELIGEIVSIRENYGFVRHPAYPKNLYFRADAVSGQGGFESLNTGALVKFFACESDRGPYATNLTRVA